MAARHSLTRFAAALAYVRPTLLLPVPISQPCLDAQMTVAAAAAARSLSTSAAVPALPRHEAPSATTSLIAEIQDALELAQAQAQLTPAALVEHLDRAIVGQADAKRAVAIAYRNRWRRQRVADPEMQQEITPKNLLLIGPTGCGKTEIARRLAKLAEAPFVKVEATKFTEVGYHGGDVDSIVRDLVEAAMNTVRSRCRRAAAKQIAAAVEASVLHALLGPDATRSAVEAARERYRAGELEDTFIDVDVPPPAPRGGAGGGDGKLTITGGPQGMSINLGSLFGGSGSGNSRGERRTLRVADARPLLEEAEVERRFPAELVQQEAVRCAEQEGIVYIDEIDKIVNPANAMRHGADPSAEGVQRDLLPLVEGCEVTTKYGRVSTTHVLFIASGAFTTAKPSDMMAELQGRLPIRVELKALSAQDFERILTEPECNMIYQQQRLMACEGVELLFTPDAVRELAVLAERINKEVENIGARRLHTVLERLVEDISFDGPNKAAAATAAAEAAAAAAAATTEAAAAAGPAAAAAGTQITGSTSTGDDCVGSSGAAGGTVGSSGTDPVTGTPFRYRHVIDADAVRSKLADLLARQDDMDKYIL